MEKIQLDSRVDQDDVADFWLQVMFSILLVTDVEFQNKDTDGEMGPFGRSYETWFRHSCGSNYTGTLLITVGSKPGASVLRVRTVSNPGRSLALPPNRPTHIMKS